MELVSIHDRPQDIDRVVRWVWDEWREHSGLSLRETRERILRNPSYPPALLAVDDDRPLGLLGFGRFLFRDEPPMQLFIDVVYVDAPLRRRGIGSALLSEGLRLAAAFDSEIHVYTQLPRWYRARGFTLVLDEPDTPNFVLRKDL